MKWTCCEVTDLLMLLCIESVVSNSGHTTEAARVGLCNTMPEQELTQQHATRCASHR